MSCKGQCYKYKAEYSWRHPTKPADAWCTRCSLSTDWEGLYCPCCSSKLRRNKRQSIIPRIKKYI